MANQRMAGDIWRTYDARSIGGEGFDDNDLRELQKRGWTNNDILKAAAASGRVDSGTDQRLRRLNEDTINYKQIPDSVKKQLFKRGELGSNYVFLGGDVNDHANYRSGPSQRGDSDNDFPRTRNPGATSAAPRRREWVGDAIKDVPVGDRSEVLRWGGINADGSAIGLRGTRVNPVADGKRFKLQEQDVSWRVPDDYLPRQESAKAPSTSKSKSATAKAEPPAPPLTERFDPTKYMLNTPVSSSSSSSSTTAAKTGEDDRQKLYGYGSSGSGGMNLGGYERFIKGLPSGLV